MQLDALCPIDDYPPRRARLAQFARSIRVPIVERDTATVFAAGRVAMIVHDSPGAIRGVLAGLASAGCWHPVIAYREAARPAEVVAAVRCGALDYFSWPTSDDELRERIAALAEEAAVHAEERIRAIRAAELVATLSAREREVLVELAGGNTNKAIGQSLTISPRTVEIHRANMLIKLGVDHSAAAISIALQSGLVNELPGTERY